jgi:hypothetical protein
LIIEENLAGASKEEFIYIICGCAVSGLLHLYPETIKVFEE